MVWYSPNQTLLTLFKELWSQLNGWDSPKVYAQHMLNTKHFVPTYITIIGEDLYDHLMSARISNLTLNKIFVQALKIMKKMTTHTIWNWSSFHINHVFCNLQEMRAKLKWPSNTCLPSHVQKVMRLCTGGIKPHTAYRVNRLTFTPVQKVRALSFLFFSWCVCLPKVITGVGLVYMWTGTKARY